MQRERGLTTVYVTHDQSEALALSYKIAVMSQGENPSDRFAARNI